MKHFTFSEGMSHPCLTPTPSPKQQLLKPSLPSSATPAKSYSLKVTVTGFKLSLCWQSLHHLKRTFNCCGSLSYARGASWCPSADFTSPCPSQPSSYSLPAFSYGRNLFLMLTYSYKGNSFSVSHLAPSVTREILVFCILDLQYFKAKQKQNYSSG